MPHSEEDIKYYEHVDRTLMNMLNNPEVEYHPHAKELLLDILLIHQTSKKLCNLAFASLVDTVVTIGGTCPQHMAIASTILTILIKTDCDLVKMASLIKAMYITLKEMEDK